MSRVPVWAWWVVAGVVLTSVLIGTLAFGVLHHGNGRGKDSNGALLSVSGSRREMRFDIPISTEFVEIDLVRDYGVPFNSDFGLYPEKGQTLFVEYKGTIYTKSGRDEKFVPPLPTLRDPDLNIRVRGSSRAMSMTVIARQ